MRDPVVIGTWAIMEQRVNQIFFSFTLFHLRWNTVCVPNINSLGRHDPKLSKRVESGFTKKKSHEKMPASELAKISRYFSSKERKNKSTLGLLHSFTCSSQSRIFFHYRIYTEDSHSDLLSA